MSLLGLPIPHLAPGHYQIITQEFFEALRAELLADPALFVRLGELRTVGLVISPVERPRSPEDP